CADLADPAVIFASDWAALAKGGEAATISEPRLVFLSRFPLPAPEARAAWGEVVATSASPRARALAAWQVLQGALRLDPGAAAEAAAWRARVAELIEGSEVSSVLAPLVVAAVVLAGETASDNAATLAALAGVLRSPATLDVQAQVVCAAYAIAADADA